jgi:hypothetical protein
MAVPVRLDYRHQLGSADMPAERRDILLDRAQVDERLRMTVHDVPVCQQPPATGRIRADGPVS